MARQGILESKKGAHGGFVLLLEMEEISIKDVIIAAEGKSPAVFDCLSYSDSCPFGAIGTCAISPFLANFQTKVDDFLDDLTLKDIL